MKRIIVMIATILLPFGATTALANPLPSAIPVEPSNIEPSNIEPIDSSIQTNAAGLGTPEIGVDTLSGDNSGSLDVTSEQVNQGLSQNQNQDEEPVSSPNEFLSLPEGMVVRGTQRGGLAIGSEF